MASSTLSADRGPTGRSALWGGVAPTPCEVKGTTRREIRGEIVERFEEEAGAREWSFVKIAVDVGADTGPIDMRGVGTAKVSEEGVEGPLRNGAEAAALAYDVVVSGGR